MEAIISAVFVFFFLRNFARAQVVMKAQDYENRAQELATVCKGLTDAEEKIKLFVLEYPG